MNKTIQELSAQLGRDKKSTEAMLESFCRIMAQEAGELGSLAVAGFGTFTGVKYDEKTVADPVSGNMLLLPPEIRVEFTAATKLRKIADKCS